MSSTNRSLPVITIIGSGYVGVTSAAIFANAGYKVYALEINPERLSAIKSGRSFFYEAHLNPLLKRAVDSGKLAATDSYKDAIPHSDIVFSCVGTPDNPDGSSNLEYVFAAASETARHAKPGLVYVQKSTVPVGTGTKVGQIFQNAHTKISYVSNPEFLREGTALQDSLYFDRVVVGGSNNKAKKTVADVYRNIVSAQNDIAKKAGIKYSKTSVAKPEYISVGLNSAELIKVSANAFLALKISFANSIAKLADAAKADVVEVMDAIGADQRIGRAFLNAGRGYGGGCFPKDVSGLISSGLQQGISLSIMQAVRDENDTMPRYILEKAKALIGKRSFAGKKVALLGITFKAGTSDIRKSPAVRIANLLSEEMDALVYIYDPQAFIDEEAHHHLHKKIKISRDIHSSLAGAEVTIIATDWPEFMQLQAETYADLMNGTILIDTMNCLDPRSVRRAGLQYIGVGR